MKGDGSGRDGQLPELLLELPPFLMLEILRAGRRAAEASERGPRLHHISVLACLEEFGPQSQREVAGRLRRDPSDLVAVIDQLEREGHARRERDPRDRRRNALSITDAGRAWLRAIRVESAPAGGHLLAALDADEEAELVTLLQRVLGGLDDRVPERYR